MVNSDRNDADAEKTYRSILLLIETQRETTEAVRATYEAVRNLQDELTRPAEMSPLPGLLATIIERMALIESRIKRIQAAMAVDGD